jgi:hypothetical protein
MINFKNVILCCLLIPALSCATSYAQSAAPLILNGELGDTQHETHVYEFNPVVNGAKFISKYGAIEKTIIIKPGMSTSDKNDSVIAWLVKSGNQKKVLFSNYKASYLWAGDMWRSNDGENISSGITVEYMEKNGSQYIPSNPSGAAVLTAPAPAPTPIPETIDSNKGVGTAKFIMDGKWVGDVPDVLKKLDSFSSIKEGSGEAGDTVYIFIDPRCPWCHKTYQNTRVIVKKGYTIKWIPTNLLGGDVLSSAIIDSNDLRVFNLIMTTPTQSLSSLTQKMPDISPEKKIRY